MSLSGPTVLVTGATGFLGSALAIRLSQEGAQVRALARRPVKSATLHNLPDIEIVSGDITDLKQMHEIVDGCKYVFHAAAAMSGTMRHQYRINVEGTHNVMVAAASARVKRIIHVSSVAVYGYGHVGDITEDSPLQARKVPYNITKMQAEASVRDICTRHQIEYSIIRPGMIYGPRSNMWTKTMFKVARLKPTIFPGSGKGSVHPIFVDDVVDLMMALALHPKAVGEAFNCSADPAPTWREFLSGYSRLAGHDEWLSLPVYPFKLIAPVAEAYLTLRGEPQEIPEIINFLQSRLAYKMTKAHERLGWQPKVSLSDGIQRCLPWLREQGLLS
jgi:nucleoside-diphosphate-sugar epimerase